jgi:tRNA pseudouridine55 synthase
MNYHKDGFLIINKPKDFTSRDVVNVLNKKLKTKKIGHTGTLDPLATGVLVICVGKATKLADMITSYDKEYIATIRTGIKTDTYDITGNILDEKDSILSEEEIVTTLNSLVGTYLQEVPIFSAVKVKGKKLYEYARENKEVILPKKEITVHSIDLIKPIIYDQNKTIFTIKVKVSKGTYIRSLINDFAIKLNTIAVMQELERTKQGDFKIEDSHTLDEKLELIPIERIIQDIPVIITEDKRVINGNKVINAYSHKQIIFKNNDNELIGLYEDENGVLVPKKMF